MEFEIVKFKLNPQFDEFHGDVFLKKLSGLDVLQNLTDESRSDASSKCKKTNKLGALLWFE